MLPVGLAANGSVSSFRSFCYCTFDILLMEERSERPRGVEVADRVAQLGTEV